MHFLNRADAPSAIAVPKGSDSAHEWHRRMVRGVLRRRLEVATYLGGLVGVLAVWAIARWRLTAHRPLWLILSVFALVGVAGWTVDAVHHSRRGWLLTQLRAAVPAIGVTVIIYLIGWGPALAVGYVFPMLNMAFYGATRRAFDLAVWPVLGMTVAQALVGSHAVHLLLAGRDSFALAIVGSVAVVFASVVIAQVAEGKEEAERELAYAASHDLLTGLMNRSAFTESLTRLVAAGRRHGRPVALLFCDLVGFKQVNDHFGHAAGDLVLAEVARRIAASSRTEDLVARFGGDEFVIAPVAPHTSLGITALADRVLALLDDPIDVGADHSTLGFSVGVAYCGTGQTEVNDLLSEADAAMYQAKALGTPARVLRLVGPIAGSSTKPQAAADVLSKRIAF